jgi:hypothetical protein
MQRLALLARHLSERLQASGDRSYRCRQKTVYLAKATKGRSGYRT